VLKKDLGLFLLIVVVGLVVSILNPRFLSPINLGNTANLIGLFGLFSIGEGFVIITGGIDLAIGSMFALLGVIYIDLLVTWQLEWWIAVLVVILGGVVLGAIHGFLVTRLRLQPFIVTLCGLLIYRGVARFLAGVPAVVVGIVGWCPRRYGRKRRRRVLARLLDVGRFVAAAQPGIYTQDQTGTGPGVIFDFEASAIVTPGKPAQIGDTITIYCNGLGDVSTPVPTEPLARTLSPVTVTIGGVKARVDFAGLAPGFPDLYQVNAVIPAGAPHGDAIPIVLAVSGQSSPSTVTIAIR